MKLLSLIILSWTTSLGALEPTRFASQIEKLLSRERTPDSEKAFVVFTGSSSIARWKSLETDFPRYNVVNFGFGGSQFCDLIFYYHQLVKEPAPDILFIYEGDNDIASGKTPAVVFEEAKLLFEKIQKDLPLTQVFVISPKPSLANWDKRARYLELNSHLKSYCQKKQNFDFLDVWKLMVDQEGIVLQDLFLEDHDHMNAKGYQIWFDAVEGVLEKNRK